MTARIHLGIFDYVNIWPLYYDFLFGREKPEGFRLVYGAPAHLNRLFSQGVLPASCLSSNQYSFLQNQARVLPSPVLASCGPVQSVILISSRAIEQLSGMEISVPQASSTSTVLLKIILARMKINAGLRVCETPRAALQNGAPAALFIGDDALLAGADFPDHLHYDLGGLWQELTGKAFVWALWGIHGRAAAETGPAVLKALSRSLKNGLAQIGRVSFEAAGRLGMKEAFLERYYRNFHYRWNPEILEGLLLFYAMAHDLDLGPKCERICFETGGSHRRENADESKAFPRGMFVPF